MSSTLKTWTRLGLGAVAGTALLTACSPGGEAGEHASEKHADVKISHGEGGEGELGGEGEGTGGEGEGGVSIDRAATDPIVFTAALAITEAHVIAARDAYAAGEVAAAAEMFAHPVSEVLFDLEPILIQQGVEPFDALLSEASGAALEGAGLETVSVKTDAILSALKSAAQKAPDDGSTLAEISAGVAADQIERAADMYRAAQTSGAYEPYLDGYGSYKAGLSAFVDAQDTITLENPDLANALSEALTLLATAYPSAAMPETLTEDTETLTASASKAQLALGR